jgi:hypothetical protein
MSLLDMLPSKLSAMRQCCVLFIWNPKMSKNNWYPKIIDNRTLWALYCCTSCFFFLFGRTGVWTQDFVPAKQRLHCLNHTSSQFCCGYFGDGVLWTTCLGWSGASILLISDSQVARITGVSHWSPALLYSLLTMLYLYISIKRFKKLSLNLLCFTGKAHRRRVHAQ